MTHRGPCQPPPCCDSATPEGPGAPSPGTWDAGVPGGRSLRGDPLRGGHGCSPQGPPLPSSPRAAAVSAWSSVPGVPAAAGAAQLPVGRILPARGRRLRAAAGGKGWSGLGLRVCRRFPLQTVSRGAGGGERCRLDADQMALGADEPLAGALRPRELPLPPPALLAVGSGGRGINLLLALPWAGGGWSPCQPRAPHGAIGGAPPDLLSPLWGPPRLPRCFPGGFSLCWE